MTKSSTESSPSVVSPAACTGESGELGAELEKGLARLGETLDLEETARQSGALTRHRGVRSARDLLRIVLGYSVWDWSLRLLGVWCVLLGLSTISKTALRQHLRQCRSWLGLLIGFMLQQHQVRFPAAGPLRVKVIDASVICQPGSRGTDWRVHLGFDLNRAGLDQIELTDGHGGESLARFTWAPGDLCLADRGYAVRSSLGPVLAAGAWLLLRVGWLKLPFEDAQAHAFDLIGWLKQAGLTPGTPAQEVAVWVQTPQGRFPLRLVAQAIPAEAAEEARRRLHKDARKHHRTADARSLFAAGFVLLTTNLPATPWGAPHVMQLYRFRWQVELAFKRLKSILQLDHLRARDPELAQVYLLSKLLAALLVDHIQLALAAQFPETFTTAVRPLSLWRLTRLVWEELRSLLRGKITLHLIEERFPDLQRFLCDEPRQRVLQRVQIQKAFSGLCGC
jgi:hypothetical protein